MKRTPRIWSALGAAVLTTSTAHAFPAADFTGLSAADTPISAILVAAEGGEGGEGGEAAMATTAGESEANFLAAIGFLDGHLRAAADIYALGDKDMAYVSASRGAFELDENFEAAREKFGAKPFDEALAAFVKATEDGAENDEIQARYADVHAILMDAVKGREARPVLDAVITLVRTSGQEYAGAVEDGTVEVPMEFQHSYGFVQIAKDMLAAMDADERAENADVFEKIESRIAEIDGAWPDLTGESGATMEASQIAATASRIELDALKVK